MSFAVLLTQAAGIAQDAAPPAVTPGAPSSPATLDLGQTAEVRSSEWITLAAALEQKIARMLPCDARVRSTIEEVARASDARFTALEAYWQDIAAQSQARSAAAKQLLADYAVRAEAWKADREDADKEQEYVSQQFAALRQSAAKQWALSDAVNALGPIAMAKREAAARAAEREKIADLLRTSLTEIAATSDARQASVEKERQALIQENNRWREYYAARIIRAQTECQLTGAPAAAPPKPATGASRPAAGKKGR